MKIDQKLWTDSGGWKDITSTENFNEADLVLVFGGKGALSNTSRFEEIRSFYSNCDIVLCSTAGEILDEKVSDETINATAIKFSSTRIKAVSMPISNSVDSYKVGKDLIAALSEEDLRYTLVISDGHIVNGSELTKALAASTSENQVITGGLAGDGPNFQSTLVGLNDYPKEGQIVGVGFYGDSLKVGHAAKGGWDPFGPERMVTKAKENVLYELDGQSALDLYKKYLGELAEELPGSALLFPLSIQIDKKAPLVRTVLSIDEKEKSMTFAGDIPEGSKARMMRSNFERLIDGAADAANTVIADFGSFDPEFALLISCAGRKFALGERVEMEVETVREILGDKTSVAGFYSYGEISPVVSSTKCELHNQTMTITTFKED